MIRISKQTRAGKSQRGDNTFDLIKYFIQIYLYIYISKEIQ
jgi:hypothetical protein